MFPMTEAFRISRMEPPKGGFHHMVLDTDTFNEEDDQFALAYAALSHKAKKLCLEAVYAAPFTHPEQPSPKEGMLESFDEIHHILSLVGMDDGSIPVFKGSESYMRGKINRVESLSESQEGLWMMTHPADDPKPVESPAARDLIERAMNRTADDPLYVCAIGCPVNVASALILKPEIAEKIVVVFLGTNQPDWPDCIEYNCRQDLLATRVLLDSKVPLVLLPCYNVVRNLTTTVYELEHFLGGGQSKIGTYLTELVREKRYRTRPSHLPQDKSWAASKVIWDIAAVAYVLHSEYTTSVLMPAPHLSSDLKWMPDHSRHLIRVVNNIYRDDVFSDFFATLGSRQLQ